jgi:hypothetical protein
MKVSGIAKAFEHHGAMLSNVMYSVSARTPDAVVLSLWQHRFRGSLYVDCLSRWSGTGNTHFAEHLRQAVEESLPVRIVIAVAADPDALERGQDVTTMKKTYWVRDDVVGRVVLFDGDAFHIQLERVGA